MTRSEFGAFKRWEIVRVVWLDACGGASLRDPVERAITIQPNTVESVGYFLGADDLAVRICGGHEQEETAWDTLVIPISQVLACEKIGP